MSYAEDNSTANLIENFASKLNCLYKG